MSDGNEARLTCHQVESEDLLERYLMRDLPDDLREAFEEHYFTCDRCAGRVGVATALNEALKKARFEEAHGSPDSPPEPDDPARKPTLDPSVATGGPYLSRGVLMALAASLVIGVVGIGYLSWGDREGTVAAAAALRELGHVGELPAYVPARLRDGDRSAEGGDEIAGGDPDSARSLYLRGMERYSERDLEGAQELLQRAVALDPMKPVMHYYLGAVLLASDQPEAAIPHLRRARAQPALEHDAGWYLSKAFLSASDPTAALHHLDELARSDGEFAERARMLRERVRAVVGRR